MRFLRRIMMAEMSPNPSVSQVNESGSTNPANANIRVAKFAGQLAQSGRANGGNFRSEQIERLVSRLAVPAEPQSENVDPDLSATASAILEELAEAIDTEESKIGIGTKLLALIISWFGGDSYDTAIAKQAFRSIENKETRTALLVLAFEAATVPADPEKESDMQEN
ncbi:MAG: hypothetical protein LBC11_03090, partial [Puniceicoccales bacterium]|nr:hypothetical protein [Puniceicoccales bacterium]